MTYKLLRDLPDMIAGTKVCFYSGEGDDIENCQYLPEIGWYWQLPGLDFAISKNTAPKWAFKCHYHCDSLPGWFEEVVL